MIKVTVLYGHPIDIAVFETYYANIHLPLVAKTKEIKKSEFTTFLPNPNGSPPPYYRMAELYFVSPPELQQALASADGKAMAEDVANFASGGATVIVGTIDQ